MYKHFILAIAFLNGLILYHYITNGISLSKFNVIAWGFCTILSLLTVAIRLFAKEKRMKNMQKEIQPILENIHLTEEQQKDKIVEVLKKNVIITLKE